MKKLLLIITAVASFLLWDCAYAATSLFSNSFGNVGFWEGTNLCAVGDTIVLSNFFQRAGFSAFRAEDNLSCTEYAFADDEGVIQLVGGDRLYALTSAGKVCRVNASSFGVESEEVATIHFATAAGDVKKGILVHGQWLVLLHDSFSATETPNRGGHVYSLSDGHESFEIPQKGIVDIAAYQEGKCLLLCCDRDSMAIYEYDLTARAEREMAVFDGAYATAGIAYYAAANRIYVVRADGIWSIQEDGRQTKEGFLAWPSISSDTFATMTENGTYAVYNNSDFLIYDLNAMPAELDLLSIACPQFEAYCKGALAEYKREHPNQEIDIQQTGALSAEDFFRDFQAQSAPDIIGVENMETLEILIDKGYCADLSANGEIAAAMDRMSPLLSGPLHRGERIYAIPYYAVFSPQIPGYHPEAMRQLGITEAELPATWSEFFDFIEKWAFDPALEENGIVLIRQPFTLYGIRETILLSIAEQQIALCQQAGASITFDTPAVRELLTRLDELSGTLDALEAAYTAQAEYAESEPPALLILDYTPIVGDGDKAMNTNCVMLPLRIAQDTAMLFPVHQGFLVIHAGSEHIDDALRLFELILAHMEQRTKVLLFSDQRAPVEKTHYQSSLAEYKEREEAAEQRIQSCTDPGEQKALQDRWAFDKQEWLFSLAHQYEITPEGIAVLESMDSRMVPSLGYHFFRQQNSSISHFYQQYLQRTLSANQLIDSIERILQMQRLEQR